MTSAMWPTVRNRALEAGFRIDAPELLRPSFAARLFRRPPAWVARASRLVDVDQRDRRETLEGRGVTADAALEDLGRALWEVPPR